MQQKAWWSCWHWLWLPCVSTTAFLQLFVSSSNVMVIPAMATIPLALKEVTHSPCSFSTGKLLRGVGALPPTVTEAPQASKSSFIFSSYYCQFILQYILWKITTGQQKLTWSRELVPLWLQDCSRCGRKKEAVRPITPCRTRNCWTQQEVEAGLAQDLKCSSKACRAHDQGC